MFQSSPIIGFFPLFLKRTTLAVFRESIPTAIFSWITFLLLEIVDHESLQHRWAHPAACKCFDFREIEFRLVMGN